MAIGFGTYGTLYPPYVAVRAQASVKGFSITSFQKFGNVNAVNYANQVTSIGSSVLFTVADAILVTAFHNGDYYIVDENKLIFRENI